MVVSERNVVRLCVCLSVSPLVAPSIADSSPSEVTVVAGQSALLPCDVTGKPRPQVTWTRNGVRVRADTDPHYYVTAAGGLEILSARRDDSATYACTAINAAGVADKRVVLFVNGNRQVTVNYTAI